MPNEPVQTAPTAAAASAELKRIPIAECVAVQARVEMNDERVTEYNTALDDGAVFPPIRVFHDGDRYFVYDGNHRLEAHRRTGAKEIEATVAMGSHRDAILAAAGANSTHGLSRSQADKRKAVEILLSDSEWTQWSDNKIAGACGVSRDLVGSVRRSLGMHKPEKARTIRNGKPHEMKTSNIGRKKPESVEGAPVVPESESSTSCPAVGIEWLVDRPKEVVVVSQPQEPALRFDFDVEIERMSHRIDEMHKALSDTNLTEKTWDHLSQLEARVQSFSKKAKQLRDERSELGDSWD